MAKYQKTYIGGGKGSRETIRKHCKKKVSYKYSEDAWEDAVYQSVIHNELMAVYKCPFCPDYHLSSKHSVGDASHIPEQYREQFLTFTNQDVRVSFFQKFREWIGYC